MRPQLRKMSPSDKIIAGTHSNSGEGQTQEPLKTCSMNNTSELGTASTSDGSLSGKISSIPLITASLSTLKCSISDKMKTFDPGEEGAIERLANNHCMTGSSGRVGCGSSGGNSSNGNSCSGLIKNANKNYKAGSKINKLADMLAKRSQNVVEVTQSDSSSLITDISVGSITEMKDGNAANFGKSVNDFQKTANGNELDLYRKSRRKSVPNQSCNLNQLEVQSTSKSCLDLTSLFTMQEDKQKSINKDDEKSVKPKFNALGGSLLKLQTDESTKRKAVRKNLKNVELTLILPEKKRRFSTRNENHLHKKVDEKPEANQTTENPNETSSVASPIRSVSSTNSKRETRGKQRRSKRLVETSTQTADIEFIALINQKGNENDDERESEENKNSQSRTECVRCSQILPLERECKNQSSKNGKLVIKCQFCSRKLPTVDELKLHYVKKHPSKYVHCLKCVAEEKLDKLSEEIQLVKESDVGDEENSGNDSLIQEEKQSEKTVLPKQTSKKGDLKIDVSYEGSKKCSVSPRNLQKYSPKEVKTEEQLIEMEMLFYSHLSGNIQENLANHLDGKMGQNGCTINTDSVMGAAEGNVIGMGQSAKTKGPGSSASVVPGGGVQEVPSPRAPSPYRTRSKTPNPLPPPTAKKFKKLPNWQQKFWEKYNFPTNYRYEHRFWDKNYLDTEKSALYLKDLSCLDIKTQLTMRENIKKLDSIKLKESENAGGKVAENLPFPAYLSLVPKVSGAGTQQEASQASEVPVTVAVGKSRRPSRKELPVTTTKTRKEMLMEAKRQAEEIANDGGKMTTRRQNSLDLLVKGEAEESAKKRKGSLDLSLDKRMTLRRQASADNLQKNGTPSTGDKSTRMHEIGLSGTNAETAPLSPIGTAEISGEWVKPRSYLCGTCCAKFSNLWDLEDHKWVSHPNVWCTHYEFEDDKIEKLFQMNEEGEEKGAASGESSNVRLSDLYKRYLLPHGTLKTAKLVPSTNYPEQCTKCEKNCMNLSEMHKHMLDCGGDTTWFLTMFSSPMTVKRKWRPFGSRRRKQIGRQIKRNIPNTPNIRSYPYQQHRIRTKPGDVESIQKMLANLPEKRARRAINFDEIKTRSQVTIHSNRMLRKRFKSSFANNYLKMKNLNQRRPLKSGKKEGSSKSTTDTSSESTPVASPKRRNKLREAVQGMKEESGADVSNESSNDSSLTVGRTTKKNQKKNGFQCDSPQMKAEDQKSGKLSSRRIREEIKTVKPMTRSHSSTSNSPVERFKRKSTGINGNDLEISDESVKEEGRKMVTRSTADSNGEDSIKETRVTEIHTITTKGKNEKVSDKKSKSKAKGKKEEEERKEELLRLKHPTGREKTDLVKKINKTLTNPKKIIDEVKELTETPNGSRRSLRLKSIQGGEDNAASFEEQVSQQETKEPDDSFQKESKIKRSTSEEEKSSEVIRSQRELRMTRSNSGETTKMKISEGEEKHSKSVQEKKTSRETKQPEVQDKLRRSSRCIPVRKSASIEDKMDDSVDKIYPSPPILRRHSKNISDAESDDSVSIKRSSRLNSFSDEACKSDSGMSKTRQGTVPAARRLLSRGKTKDSVDPDAADDNKNQDLEEMPILAKVEPLQGKFFRKKEEEDIPVLMPATEVTSRNTRWDDSVKFQVVKKRKTSTPAVTTSKEVAPLKIIKKIGNSGVRKEGDITFRLEGSNRDPDLSRPKRRMSSEKEVPPSNMKPCKSCKRSNKYFLGICPCEIDKGKEEGDDDSGGSDSEPLIMLKNQSQKDHPVVKKDEESSPVLQKAEAPTNLSKDGTVEEKLENLENLPAPVLTPEKTEIFTEKPFNVSPDIVECKPEVVVEVDQTNDKRCKKKKTSGKKTLGIVLGENISTFVQKPAEVVEKPSPEIGAIASATSTDTLLGEILPERRSRRISKETKSTSEFVIDDPLILVDELWSDLDSDSETTRRKSKKSRKKTPKKKSGEERKSCQVDLEELLRNFGENKEPAINNGPKPEKEKGSKTEEVSKGAGAKSPAVPVPKPIVKRPRIFRSVDELRQKLERRSLGKSGRRLSLKLFRFNKSKKNLGSRGQRLWEAKMIIQGSKEGLPSEDKNLPDLPFLVAEIKENPVQVIQCRSQKSKSAAKKSGKTGTESKYHPGCIHLKISLPLESINNMAVFNNNHLTELDVEKQSMSTVESHAELDFVGEDKPLGFIENPPILEEPIESGEMKNKIKRSEVIDKIFYCEICQTYYYSSSQLKIHKLSNRHKIKEAEMLCSNEQKNLIGLESIKDEDKVDGGNEREEPVLEGTEKSKSPERESESVKDVEPEKINEDTLEMPTLEGPFLEGPVTRVDVAESGPTPPVANPLKFCQESLKDIQRAIGCTDEEMLILTLLGENTIEIENDILDLDTGKPVQSGKSDVGTDESSKTESEKSNGLFKVDLKQRMTSALTCLVNKAVFNLLQKYESVAKSSVNPEAVSLLGKLSSLSRRQNILQLNDLLKRQKDGEPSVINLPRKQTERREPTVSYKYQCTICGSRFEKASTRECHISRSHKGKAKKVPEEIQVSQTSGEDEWSDYWSYDANDVPGNPSQFWCSDCGINFVSPQEVLEHQKVEHQAGVKEAERLKEASPLQSSTIGSSDEIFQEGKKSKRRSKIFSSEELDKQRIIANNELRKLDRKYSGKNKAGKIKWGMDALKFTVEKEKESSEGTGQEEVETEREDGVRDGMEKPRTEVKENDPVPKLNFTRTSNVSEFKVVQKNSLKSRFQKIIDNKLKRKGNRQGEKHQGENGLELEEEEEEEEEKEEDRPAEKLDNEQEETETEVMLVPIVVKKKNKKPKTKPKKSSEEDKTVDVYDFNESESEGEPMVLSHIKKPMPLTTKLKLVKMKEREEPSKNKADSTTKDLAPDDYDSEDSLPLSIVKKSKSVEEDEKASEDGVEKSDGILEQVEYLIEQLENETGTSDKKEEETEEAGEVEETSFPDNEPVFEEEKPGKKFEETKKTEEEEEEEMKEVPRESFRVSLASSLLTLPDLPRGNHGNIFKEVSVSEKTIQLAEPETSQSTFDEEDSMPLVLMSRRPEDLNLATKDENTTDVSTTASEDVLMFGVKEGKEEEECQTVRTSLECQKTVDSLCEPTHSPNPEEVRKPFENLNGNVIYCRNDSMSNFESDFSNDGLIDSNYEKFKPERETKEDCVKEITEKEDVVIVCSKADRQTSKPSKGTRKNRVKPSQRRRKDSFKRVQKKKKKRFPLLTATIEENNFRQLEEPKLNKEVIVRKIWNRRKMMEESTDAEDSLVGVMGNERFDDEDDNTVDNQIRNEESHTEIEKEFIVNKIWSRKKVDHECEAPEKPEEKSDDVKINQTEISDEVVIKCGPKTVTSSKKRQKSKGSAKEASKETIMRKIWSGKCMFQTKAALKTYESDVMPNRKEAETVLMQSQGKQKKRGRPARFTTSTKKIRLEETDKDDEDDLDSLLEEIEREQLEKAIRLEFLQLRRSEKGNIEISKEGVNTTMGLFTETSVRYRRDGPERKRKRIRRNLSRHPRQSLLKRKKFIKKPIRRILQSESKCFVEKSQGSQEMSGVETRENIVEVYTSDGKMKSRKHKKHRHKHHHHKHKHKKSKHRKCLVSKHKSKHKSGGEEDNDEDDEDERRREETKEVEEPETEALTVRSGAPDVEMSRLIDTICEAIPGQIDPSKTLQLPSPFTFEDSTKDCDGDEQPSERERTAENVYEFPEDASDVSTDAFKSPH